MGKSNLPALTPQQANDVLNELFLSGAEATATGVTRDQAIEALLNAKPEDLRDLTAEYWKVVEATDKGKTFHFIVEGFETMNLEDSNGTKRAVEAVRITSVKERKEYIAAQTVLVGACKKLGSLPAYVQVTYLGKQGSGNSAYDKFSVKSL